MVQSKGFDYRHMIANNAELLLQRQELDELHSDLIRIWSQMGATDKQRYYDEMQRQISFA
jgi:hypothetical protein